MTDRDVGGYWSLAPELPPEPRPQPPPQPPPSIRRPGFTLVEVLVVALTLGVLAAVAMPSYQNLTQRARAAALIEDLRTIGTAAYQYQVKHNQWPADVYPAIVPPELEDDLQGVQFRGPDYLLDWDNWSHAAPPSIGVSVLVTNPALESAFHAMASESNLWRVGDRYTYVIEGFY